MIVLSDLGVGAFGKAVDETAISLAHEAPFALGRLQVRPQTRETVDAEGRREILEPRIMQVLVALKRAEGAVLSRDDLVRLVWRQRVVGDDAINRAMSRLRRIAAEHPEAGFQVETIPRVGYRLVTSQDGPPGTKPPGPQGEVPAPAATGQAATGAASRPDRRLLLAGGALAAIMAAAGGGWLALRARRLPPLTRALYDQGWTALSNIEPSQSSQAASLFQAVVDAQPDYADGWGSLAQAYVCDCGDDVRGEARRERARAAAARALQLDPGNALATAAIISVNGIYGRWGDAEAAISQGLRRHPDADPLLRDRRWLLSSVGRTREAAQLGDRIEAKAIPTPKLYIRVQELAAAGRLEEADRTSARMIALFPANTPAWFTHFYHLMRNGRPAEALAFGMNLPNRPPGVSSDDFDFTMAGAQAVLTRSPVDVRRATEISMAAAHTASGFAENALLLFAQLGQLNDAFKVAEAYYFGRGFTVPLLSFGPSQKQFFGERRTHFLFWPTAKVMRADRRFADLVGEIGLSDYWRRSGRQPD